jgi:hypothetical protein
MTISLFDIIRGTLTQKKINLLFLLKTVRFITNHFINKPRKRLFFQRGICEVVFLLYPLC